MRVTIDNLDGAGARDYSAALAADGPLKIERVLNAPARCVGTLHLQPFGLPVPVRGASVVVTNDSGRTLFDGYVANEPGQVLAGVASQGAVHRVVFTAVSDAAEAYQLGEGTAHVLKDGDGTLQLAPLADAAVRELARDVTVSGEIEPTAYITEYFLGDGTRDTFQLTQAPFHAANTSLLDERFDEGTIDTRVWGLTNAGSFLSLTSQGLTVNGGNGLDGQTALTAIDTVEIGGTLTVEADGVTFSEGSDGVVCGLYSDAVQRGRCLAGFNVRPSGGETTVTPLVNGAEMGTTFTMLSGHKYMLRLRVHCPEVVRTAEVYTAMVEGQLQRFGGGQVAAPVSLVFELRDAGPSSNTLPTVLYSGSLTDSPGTCSFVAVNCLQMFGAIERCSIAQDGSAWIVTTTVDGTETVRTTGTPGDGVDCMLSPAGRITFFSGRIPIPGERITVMYRGRRRAAARLAEAADLPATARWEGKVAHPAARTTEDCENAAQALLGFATARSAAVSGMYAMVNPEQDIAPGNMLAFKADSDTLNAIVRTVTIEDGHARPELVTYRIGFANHWAEGLGLSLSDGAENDTLLQTAFASPPAALANLPALAVVGATGTALQVDAGVDPPVNGGFEVRRRDWAFGTGTDTDLVVRSTARTFSIPREGQVERYFVRMYDGSTPPVYSRFSRAVFTDLPVTF